VVPIILTLFLLRLLYTLFGQILFLLGNHVCCGNFFLGGLFYVKGDALCPYLDSPEHLGDITSIWSLVSCGWPHSNRPLVLALLQDPSGYIEWMGYLDHLRPTLLSLYVASYKGFKTGFSKSSLIIGAISGFFMMKVVWNFPFIGLDCLLLWMPGPRTCWPR